MKRLRSIDAVHPRGFSKLPDSKRLHGLALERRPGRQTPKSGARLPRDKLTKSKCNQLDMSIDWDLAKTIQSLQGSWVDDSGHGIVIEGANAQDHTGTRQRIVQINRRIMIGNWFLACSSASPVWQAKNGKEWKWARPDLDGFGDTQWEQLFHRYKAERLTVRRQLLGTLDRLDLEGMSLMQKAWNGGFGFAMSVPSSLRERLLLGKDFIPGSCVMHRRLHYRAVVLACEPWCKASAQWRAANSTGKLIRGDAQPYYHCAIDRRDASGDQVAFVAEEELENCFSFPLDAPLLETLFVVSKPLGAFLPAANLVRALQLHRSGHAFEVPLTGVE